MARLHSKKGGKAGSKRPKSKMSGKWVDADKNKIKEIIFEMARKGTPSSKIGLILRDKHGVPSVKNLLGKPITELLKSEGILPDYPEDLISLIKKAVKMREHIKSAAGDTHNRVKLGHVESKINRLVKYYNSRDRLPKNWKYDPEKAALLVK
ncbi:30S ribosomal protein S15 [Candidatus Micrarchaeota archaeon]|nr:30S ribosomal protein S15 [Candidatus Micrarchaeota archaeon]